MSRAQIGHRRRSGLAVVTVALVFLVGCGGDGDSGGEQSSDSTKPAPTSSTILGGDAPLAAGPSTTTAPPAGGPGPTKAGSASAASPSPTTTRPAGGRAAAPTPANVTTTPGRYRYASTGTFSAGVSGEQRRSGESILTVDPPAGADQHSLRQGDNRSTEQILRFQPDGIYVVMLKVTDQGLTKEFRPAQPVLAFPYAAPVGRTWSWRMTSTDGKTTVETSFRIERTEAVAVGPESVAAVVVQADLVTSGDLTSRGTQTLWVAESRRLVVREQSATNGMFGAFSFRSTAEERLLQLSPS